MRDEPETTGIKIHSAVWYDLVAPILFLGRDGAYRDRVLDLAGVKAGDRVLDVGCGTGSMALRAKARVGGAGEVRGIDAAREMVAWAAKKAARAGLDVGFQNALIEEIPFPDSRFDVVLSTLMIHHLPDDLKRRGLDEVRRVLRPGGTFLGVDFDLTGTTLFARVFRLMHHGHPPVNAALEARDILRGLGFKGVEAGPMGLRALWFARGLKPPA